MALDQASVAWLEQARSSGFPPVYELTPAQARENSAALRRQRQPGPGPEMARAEEARVPVAGGSVPVRVLVPAGQPPAVLGDVLLLAGREELGDISHICFCPIFEITTADSIGPIPPCARHAPVPFAAVGCSRPFDPLTGGGGGRGKLDACHGQTMSDDWSWHRVCNAADAQ